MQLRAQIQFEELLLASWELLPSRPSYTAVERTRKDITRHGGKEANGMYIRIVFDIQTLSWTHHDDSPESLLDADLTAF